MGAFSISRHKKKRPLHCKSLLGSVLAGKTLNSQFSEHKKGFIGEAFFCNGLMNRIVTIHRMTTTH